MNTIGVTADQHRVFYLGWWKYSDLDSGDGWHNSMNIITDTKKWIILYAKWYIFNGEFYDINYIFIKIPNVQKTGGTQRNVSVPTCHCLTSLSQSFPANTHTN